MTEQGKRMLERVKGDPSLHRALVESYATKARRIYGDEEAAKKLEALAADREPPRSHLTEEQREEISRREVAEAEAARDEKRRKMSLKKGGLR